MDQLNIQFSLPPDKPQPGRPDPVLEQLLIKLEALFIPHQERHEQIARCREITEQVCHTLRVDLARVLSPDRHQHVSFVRQVAMLLCRRLISASFPVIGESFNRNHTTTISDIKAVQRRIANPTSGPMFARLIEQLERQVTITNGARVAA
jgi:chromosomal replication initiation ATPase DnaA